MTIVPTPEDAEAMMMIMVCPTTGPGFIPCRQFGIIKQSICVYKSALTSVTPTPSVVGVVGVVGVAGRGVSTGPIIGVTGRLDVDLMES